MERRLQLLLDRHRYELVAREARRSKRSVAAVIREAIDQKFDDTVWTPEKQEAADWLRRRLASPPTDEQPYTGEDLALGHYGGDYSTGGFETPDYLRDGV